MSAKIIRFDKWAKKRREQKREQRTRAKTEFRVGVIDFETDPFDPFMTWKKIEPFHVTVYYSDDEYMQFCGETSKALLDQLFPFLKSCKPTIWYAHNGGRFDWYNFVHEIRGRILYKGSRLIKFHLWGHEFRDSYPLLPARLAAFQKDEFDYSKLSRCKRDKWREEIEKYCLSDCRYLKTVIDHAHDLFGKQALTIGVVARKELLKVHKVKNIPENHDSILRRYFAGGRVECLAGYGVFRADSRDPYKCYDVNSMYSFAMAAFKHPVGGGVSYGIRAKNPKITDNTVFISLRCRSRGAFRHVDEETGKISFPCDGIMRHYDVTIHEYRMALRYDALRDVTITATIECTEQTTFEKFVVDNYEERASLKGRLAEMRKQGKEDSPEYQHFKARETIIKFLLNNAYGKFAQDPDNFREYEISEAYVPKPGMRLECMRFCDDGRTIYVTSSEPKRKRYYNVGTAASITGAARAVLFELIQHAIDPIYCDTDSIICKGFRDAPTVIWGSEILIDEARLGALKLEWTAHEVGIVGKKVYYAIGGTLAKPVIKAKGHNADHLSPDKLRHLINKQTISLETTSKAPKFHLDGRQEYITRELRITAPHPYEIRKWAQQWEQISGFIRSNRRNSEDGG